MILSLVVFFCSGVIVGVCLATILIYFCVDACHTRKNQGITPCLGIKVPSPRIITKNQKFSVVNGGKTTPAISESSYFHPTLSIVND